MSCFSVAPSPKHIKTLAVSVLDFMTYLGLWFSAFFIPFPVLLRGRQTSLLNIQELKKRMSEQKKNELFNLYSRSHLSKLKNTSFIEYR